jgi:hypothetical protein
MWKDKLRHPLVLGFVVFACALLVYYFTLNTLWGTDHTTSFLELDYSMWSNHTTALGRVGSFNPKTVDVVQSGGNYYSALAPGTAFIAFPFAALGFILDGGRYAVYPDSMLFGKALLMSELSVAVANAAAVYVVYKIARLYFRETTSAFLAFSYAFATISWPFATFLFQSDTSAMFDVLAAYFVLKMGRETPNSRTWWYALFAGLAVSGGLVVDYVNAIFILVILGFIILSQRTMTDRAPLKEAIFFVAASLVGIIVVLYYNAISFGSPFVTSEQLYLHSSSFFGDFGYPIYEGLVLDLFTPYRGLFIYCPILVLGVVGILFATSPRFPKKIRREVLFMTALFLAILLPYAAWYDPDGGLSFGPRFIVASIPFLLLPAGFLLDRSSAVNDKAGNGKKIASLAAIALYVAGIFENGVAALTSALAGTGGWWSSPFLKETLPRFEAGVIDPWWRGTWGQEWWIAAAIIFASALTLPLFAKILAPPLPPSTERPKN